MATNSNNNNGGLVDVLKGDKPLQFSISLDLLSVTYLIAGALLAGVLLILISKKVIR